MSNIVRINPIYTNETHSELFYDTGYSPDRLTVVQFQKLCGVKLDDSVAIINELPNGSVICGGNFRQKITNNPVNNYDIFFDSESSFLNAVRRIMHAPEGSALHGYTPKVSLAKFSAGKDPILTFVHQSKPAIQLIRTRWFGNSEQLLQHIDLIDSMIALSSDFTVNHHSEAIWCIKNRRVKINRVDFIVGTGARLRERLGGNYSFSPSSSYGSHEREEYIRRAQRFIDRHGSNIDTRFRL